MVHSQKALKFILLWRAPKQEFLLKPRGSSTRQSVTLIMWRPSERQFKLLLISWVNPIILIVDWVIPENIHTIPQTYFVFIEMNLQCRQIHVADICLWWDEHTCSYWHSFSIYNRVLISQLHSFRENPNQNLLGKFFLPCSYQFTGFIMLGHLQKEGQNYSVTHEHFAIYCTVWMVKI